MPHINRTQIYLLTKRFVILLLGCLMSLGFSIRTIVQAAPTLNEYSLPSDSQPRDMAVGPDGNIWFTERGTANNIGKITPSGTITEYPIPTSNAGAWGITAGPDGNMWFTEESANQIGKITPSGVVTEYSIPTTIFPQGITSGPDGNLWFTLEGYSENSYIGKITTSGSVTLYHVPGSTNSSRAIVVGPDGNLWFANQGSNSIGEITTSGVISNYPLPENNTDPLSITVGPDGNLWYVGDHYVGNITTSGTITEYNVPNSDYLWGIAVGPDGNMWFTDQNAGDIGEITTSGEILSTSIMPSENPRAIIQGPDGNMWFSEGDNVTPFIGEIVFPTKPGISNLSSNLKVDGSVTVNVLSGVSGDPDPASLQIITGPSHGTAFDPPGTITYTPNLGYTGTDSLVYKVCSLDDETICSQATLSFDILAASVAKDPETGYGKQTPSNPWGTVSAYTALSLGLIIAGIGLRKSSRFKTL